MSTFSPRGSGAMLALSASLSWTVSPTASAPAHLVPRGAPAKHLFVLDDVETKKVIPEVEDASSASGCAPRTTAARQKALAGAYPDEYVVLVGDRIVVHTKDKEEAYNAAFEQDGEEPIVVPPGALRQIPPPVVRGRRLSAEPPVETSAAERQAKARELIDSARALGEARVGAEPYRFRREEIYEEREARWTGPR